jgi:hypothetical protein
LCATHPSCCFAPCHVAPIWSSREPRSHG